MNERTKIVGYDEMGQPIVMVEPEMKMPTDFNFADKLFGLNGAERYQLWPEKMARSALSLPGDVFTGKLPLETSVAAPYAIEPYSQDVVSEPNRFGFGGGSRPSSEGAIARAMDTGGFAGGATLAVKPGTASVGSGMTRNVKLTPVEGNPFVTDVFHGTTKPGFDKFKTNPNEWMPDRALGVHVAKDPEISNTFAKDEGGVYPLKIKDDSKFFEVQQDLLPYIEDKNTIKGSRNVVSDQRAIEGLIYKTAYSKDPELLARYLVEARAVPKEDALKLATDMANGKTVDLTVDGKGWTLNRFLDNFGGRAYNEADRVKAIEIFKKDLQDKGYEGIKYINTSPMETANAKDPTSYVVFDPSKSIKGKYTDTLMSDTGKPGAALSALAKQKAEPFYSTLERAVDNAKLDKGNADQWLGYLKNQPGVKSEELQWTLNNLPEGQITKEQLQGLVKENKIGLNETLLGGGEKKKFGTPEEQKAMLDRYEKAKQNLLANEVGTKKYEEAKLEWEAVQRDIKDVVPGWGRAEGNGEFYTGPTKYSQWQLPGGPLSRDTEILTKTGWKRIDSVSIGEEIITRKDEDGELEWKPILDVPSVYAEKLYHFYNQSIDMQVTAFHKMVVRKRRRSSKGIFRVTAEQLWNMSECVIPLTGIWKGKGSQKIFGYDACDIAEFIGWYIAEGSYKQKNGIKNTIQISQSRKVNPEKCDRLEALFDRLGLPWKYYGDGYGIGIKTLNKDLVKLLHEQPKAEGKFVPKFFFTESKNVLNSLLDGLILGDGHISEEGFDNYNSYNQSRRTFFSKSKQLADDVQVLALLTGYRATVRKRPTGIYSVGISLKEWNSVDDSKYAIINYHDFAFCVTVDNHCIYVRRNGVAAFTGNTNYREMLVSLPIKTSSKTLEGLAITKRMNEGRYNSLDDIARRNLFEERDRLLREGRKEEGEAFKAPHFDDKGTNLLYHARMNDRMIEDTVAKKAYDDYENSLRAKYGGEKSSTGGANINTINKGTDEEFAKLKELGSKVKTKTLHIEEIQSDWHQKGRKEGYKLSDKERPVLEKNAETVDEKLIAANRDDIMSNPDLKAGMDQAVKEKIITQKEADDYIRLTANERSTIPDAPFKKNWDEQALKRLVRRAVDEGYDAISWTPGEAQAARYDLSKHIDNIAYNPNTGYFKAIDKNGKDVSTGPVPKDKLADTIGKEAAEKLLNSKPNNLGIHSLENADLKIGGEGMKGFYDKILVDRANALGKKYGAKVEQKEIVKGWDAVDKNGKIVAGWDANTPKQAMLDWIKSMGGNYKLVENKQPIHHMKITPELKKKAMEEGFPLFTGSPVLVPIDNDPFKEQKKKPLKITVNPVTYDPFAQ